MEYLLKGWFADALNSLEIIKSRINFLYQKQREKGIKKRLQTGEAMPWFPIGNPVMGGLNGSSCRRGSHEEEDSGDHQPGSPAHPGSRPFLQVKGRKG